MIQSVWIGKALGTIEHLCIKSYLKHGHSFSLYAYHDLDVPEGTTLLDANDVLPEAEVSTFQHPAQFSDYFRYAMLLKNGGWYVDLDSVCLRPLDIEAPYVFVRDNIDHFYISDCFIKAPANSRVMQFCKDTVATLGERDKRAMAFQAIGPHLTQTAVFRHGLEGFVQPKEAFDPIPWYKIATIVSELPPHISDKSYAIHLHHSLWDGGPNAVAGKLPDGKSLMSDGMYPAGCLFEQLKREYL